MLLAYCCPNCYAYCASQAVGESTCTSLLNCLFYPLCLICLRGAARNKRGIDGGIITDCLVTQCCPCCATIQIKRGKLIYSLCF
jgi:hypothetical protein